MIKENLETVRANVHKAIEKSGRNDFSLLPQLVSLVVVVVFICYLMLYSLGHGKI